MIPLALLVQIEGGRRYPGFGALDGSPFSLGENGRGPQKGGGEQYRESHGNSSSKWWGIRYKGFSPAGKALKEAVIVYLQTMSKSPDSRVGNAEAVPDHSQLKQQNIQLQHLLKYKDDVEIPALKRQVSQLQGDQQAAQGRIQEAVRQEDFVEKVTGILHLDAENRVVKINGFALEMLGVQAAQAIGKPIRDLGAHSQSGRPIFGDIDYYLEPEGRESEWEKEIPVPNGEKRYYHFRSALLGVTRILSATDVTELRIWESRVKAIVGTSKDGIALVDEGGIIRSTNARFGKMFGLNWRQFIGMQFYIAADLLQYHFQQPREFVDFYGEIQRDPQLQREGLFEMVLPQPASYQVFTRPIVDEQSRLIGRVWFITDVSQFKEMEHKLLANAQELEEKVRQRTEELSTQNQELMRVRQETEIELEMAKQVQQGMLPLALPSPAGYELAADYVPTGMVGGDFYHVGMLDADHLFLLVIDVSGHGVPAALITAMAKMAFDRHVRPGRSVAEALGHVNVDLCKAVKAEHYLTAFAGIVEIPTGILRYCRVGHPYPLVFRRRGRKLERLEDRGGFFLGMFPETKYEGSEIRLEPGDLLFVYTDGITETMNSEDKLYGRKRLEEAVLSVAADPDRSPAEILREVQSDKDRFAANRPSQDDISLLALRRLA